MVVNKWNITLFFQQNNNNLNAGISSRLHARETALSLSTVESIVLLTLWFIILSCLGRCSKRPSRNILLNRSIVHAIRMHVSEVPFSGAVSAHTIVCVCVLCTHYVCVPRPSADSAVCVHARNRRCSKIKQTNILLICASVLQYINSIWINYC